MLNIFTPAEAQRTILRRDHWLQRELPDSLKERIRRIFGEALTPEQAVSRILLDVRSDGDAALRRWTERIDGISLQQFAVPTAQIAAAAATVHGDL